MGSKDKYFGINTLSHGFDDVGLAQPSGGITSFGMFGGNGKWAKYAMVTASAAHNLVKGQAINITGSTDYDGPTRVIHIVSSTIFVIKRGFTKVGPTGSWDVKGGDSNWDAFMPIGANVSGAALSMTYWRPDMQGGTETGVDFTQDKVYVFPGGIKRVAVPTGNIRLFRAASVRPGGVKSPTPPSINGYRPTGGASGETIDIIGREFDPALGNNSVWFYNGASAIAAQPSRVDQDGCIITVAVPSAATTAGIITVKTNGLATATGPTFNVH